MKKIVIFGGAGFLGSHVADALTKVGYAVTVFDLKLSPYLKPGQKMVQGDILDEKMVREVVHGHDIVYHFAGIANIEDCTVRPVETVRYNILGTAFLLDACRKAEIERFVFASSAYVYSKYGHFYRTSKQCCESLIEDYHALYGLKYTCLRYGSLYGERADERNTIYKILMQALVEGKITYYGTGDEIREFIHVEDAAESSVKILTPEFENQYIILSGTQTMRYSELLQMVQEMLQQKIPIEILPSDREAHYKITPYNFSPKLGKRLVTNPYVDMGQGLLRCMAEIYESLQHGKYKVMDLIVDHGE